MKSAHPEVSVPVCPYCQREAVATHTRFGWQWRCTPCDARVGCHRDTQRPLGTLANAALRAARCAAHESFDVLWQAKLRREPDISRSRARGHAYAWLATQLQLEPERCHIGEMDIPTCMRVVEICAPFTARARRTVGS